MGKMTSTKIYVFGSVLGLFRAWAVPKQKPGEGALAPAVWDSLGLPGMSGTAAVPLRAAPMSKNCAKGHCKQQPGTGDCLGPLGCLVQLAGALPR